MKIAAIVGLAIVMVALFVWAIMDQNAWEDGCVARGGHVSSHTSWHTSIDSHGKPYSSSDTTYYCLSNDGRILDIR